MHIIPLYKHIFEAMLMIHSLDGGIEGHFSLKTLTTIHHKFPSLRLKHWKNRILLAIFWCFVCKETNFYRASEPLLKISNLGHFDNFYPHGCVVKWVFMPHIFMEKRNGFNGLRNQTWFCSMCAQHITYQNRGLIWTLHFYLLVSKNLQKSSMMVISVSICESSNISLESDSVILIHSTL